MEDSFKKRKRTENYTSGETLKLIECVRKYQHIVENKKTDAFTWKQKDLAWERISQEYNRSNTNMRTAKMLRSKFETLKKEARKYAAALRQSGLQTGGGPPTKIKPNLILDRVQEIIFVEGHPSVFDAYKILEAVSTQAEKNVDENCVAAEAVPELLSFEMDGPMISPESLHSNSYTSELNTQDQPLQHSTSAGDGSSYAGGASSQCHQLRHTRHSSVRGQKLNSSVTEKSNMATLQQQLLREQFTQRERREKELHEYNVQIKQTELLIKKAELINHKLDIKMKRKTLKKLEETL